jgi:MOSC domain-containing protein YiiM
MVDCEEMKAVPRIVAINISSRKGIPKVTVPSGLFIEDFGLEGDAHAGKWHRQVSLLALESIQRMTALGVTGLCPGSFAENVTTENIVLFDLKPGDQLFIDEVVLEVTQIGKECHQKCAIYHQIGKCAMPAEGIFTRVLQGGTLHPGQEIKVVNSRMDE